MSYNNIIALWIKSLLLLSISLTVVVGVHSFVIDYDNNTFLKDGKPFRYISGSMHYTRIPAEYWRDRLTKLYAAGFNAVQTYVPWNHHQPHENVLDFTGSNHLEGFIKTAQDVGLLVILRPGPYIDAEMDMGGFPYWLLTKHPEIRLRTSDAVYLEYVTSWFNILLPKIAPLLYHNGGPIIMVQVENEYGSYGCDKVYLKYLTTLTRKHLGEDIVLFTTDGFSVNLIKCGTLPELYSTIDFGTSDDVSKAFANMREVEPNGPLVNSEYYTGWFDYWGNGGHSRVSIADTVRNLAAMLQINASVNIYMFHGGTNFELSNGADISGTDYQPVTTSYDYDAPLNEAGDPTPKYYAIRNEVAKYTPLPIPVPPPTKKNSYGIIKLLPIGSLTDMLNILWPHSRAARNSHLRSFEELNLNYGFLLYRTNITNINKKQTLTINNLRDIAYIIIDKQSFGFSYRNKPVNISVPAGLTRLDILVENMGRICYGKALNEGKGIGSAELNGKPLENWDIFRLGFEPLVFKNHINQIIASQGFLKYISKWVFEKSIDRGYDLETNTPFIYRNEFFINESDMEDTFLDMSGWNKGIAILNGKVLGRYWSAVGPQLTLFIPKSALQLSKSGRQVLVVIELVGSPCSMAGSCSVAFVKAPKWM